MPNYPNIDYLTHVRRVREAAHAAGVDATDDRTAGRMSPWLSIGNLEVHHRDPEVLVLALADIAVQMALPPATLVADAELRRESDGLTQMAIVVTNVADAEVQSVTVLPHVVDELGIIWDEPFSVEADVVGYYWGVLCTVATVGQDKPWLECLAASIFRDVGATVARPGLIGGAR